MISSRRGISLVSLARKNIKPLIDTPQNNNKAISLDMRRSDTQVMASAKLMTAHEGIAWWWIIHRSVPCAEQAYGGSFAGSHALFEIKRVFGITGKQFIVAAGKNQSLLRAFFHCTEQRTGGER